ncbi:TNF receptor-associated protein 1, mitochondrial [Saguinus oedipus]|uniref:TNF receptor-associated protein 1, mitochondrial n=1 Tax=Saguinus oedipus TaxID=9490 RepID=A0ABQ9WDF1_SAGOE|nr:TNF receptor-associated protein 1, mitochondrial [Saguinus oedipus]
MSSRPKQRNFWTSLPVACTQKKVFIWELISSASHALEKLHHKLVSDGQALPEMEIHLQPDAKKGTITIQGTGIGMTQEELVSNLGTIARPGSKAFLDALQNQAEASSKIIGQFGVGFYSAFMVADRVEVYSRLASPGCLGYQGFSDGSGVFEIGESLGVRTETKIIIHLKSDCREFASEALVRDVVTKYSNFVSFPLYLNGRRMNTLQAIWMMDPKLTRSPATPCYTLHYKTVAPLNIRSVFYVPDAKPSVFDVSRKLDSSIALYSLKVLIQTKATDILPKWLCFIRAVVVSEDIPLNLSRELLQESALIRKLRDVLQQRLIKFLVYQSKKDAEKYAKFLEDYGLFMREGIVTTAEQEVKEDIAKLLRYESSALPAGQLTSLLEYANRMRVGTRNTYYLCAPSRHLAEHSPYYEAMKQKDTEFDKKKLISVETDIIVDHYKEERFKDGSPAAERLSEKETEDLIAWMRNVLGSRVTNVKQLAKTQEGRAQLLQPTLEINPRHALMKLNQLQASEPGLAQLLVDQIYENAVIAAGLVDDPRAMVGRLNELLVKTLERH